ncbi:MAG: hypothetical protein Q9157_005442 [Trypethelium eluteriae]
MQFGEHKRKIRLKEPVKRALAALWELARPSIKEEAASQTTYLLYEVRADPFGQSLPILPVQTEAKYSSTRKDAIFAGIRKGASSLLAGMLTGGFASENSGTTVSPEYPPVNGMAIFARSLSPQIP